MERLLWHRMSVPYRHYSPELRNFSANGIFYAQKGDMVLIDQILPEELMRFYADVGIIPDQFVLIGVNMNGTLPINVKERIRNLAADFFMFSSFEEAFFRKHELKLDVHLSRYESYVSKSRFKELCSDLGYATPLSNNKLRKHSLQLKKDALELFLQGSKKVIIKSDNSVAGLNTYITGSAELLISSVLFKSMLPHQEVLIPEEYFFAEQWYEDVTSSPSIQFFIEDDVVTVCSVHNQLFYENKRTYRGCQSEEWLPASISDKVHTEGRRVARSFQSLGYRGHLGLNAIVVSGGELVWVEANPRRVMSSYAKKISERTSHGQPYVSYQISRPSWKGATVTDLLKAVGPSLFKQSTMEGVIPFDSRLLSEGSISFFFTAQTKERIKELIQHVTDL